MMQTERRAYKRFDMSLPLYYRRLDQGEFFRSESKNISEGGLRVALKESERKDRFMEFRLLMPKVHDTVDVVGRVAWVKADEEVEAGIEFVDSKTNYRDKIRMLCQR